MIFKTLIFACREARILFKAGRNREGYFENENLLEQTKLAMEIFKEKHPGDQMLILFDNATTHQARAKDALSALKMPLRPKLWITKNQTCRMRNGMLRNGEMQAFYYPDDDPDHPGHFKGMATLLEERGFNIKGLRAQCKTAFANCNDPSPTGQCCCRRILYNEPDFAQQKGSLQELIEKEGHICDFYPKFHPELNFIEQYWGAAKYTYRLSPPSSRISDMEKNMIHALDKVPLLLIRRSVHPLEPSRWLTTPPL